MPCSHRPSTLVNTNENISSTFVCMNGRSFRCETAFVDQDQRRKFGEPKATRKQTSIYAPFDPHQAFGVESSSEQT